MIFFGSTSIEVAKRSSPQMSYHRMMLYSSILSKLVQLGGPDSLQVAEVLED